MSEGRMLWNGKETWYRIVGDLASGPTPVVICHGGPGAAHDYTEPIAELSRFGRDGCFGFFCYPIKLRSHCALYLVLFSLGQGPQRWGTSERAFLMRSLE